MSEQNEDIDFTDSREGQFMYEDLRRINELEQENQKLREELARYEWRPIESAPKDGTSILVCNATIGGEPMCAHYSAIYNNWQLERKGVWIPTHWMPLHEPPAPEEPGT